MMKDLRTMLLLFFVSWGLACIFLLCGCQEALDDTDCQGYGATPGTDAYTQCRATLAASHNHPIVLPPVYQPYNYR